MVVEARGLDEVTPGEFIECQALRPNSGALCNSKIIKGQECEGPGKEWPEKKEEKQERVILKQFLLVEHNSTYRRCASLKALNTSYRNLILSLISLKLLSQTFLYLLIKILLISDPL